MSEEKAGTDYDVTGMEARSPPPPENMGRRAATGAVWVAASHVVKVAVTMLSTIVVARLLSPHAYGIVAMTAPVVAFLQTFQTLGLNQAMVQRPVISPAQFGAMFWLNLRASAVIAAALFILSPLVGLFYGEPTANWLCAAVLLTGFTLQHAALLNPAVRFGRLSVIDMSVNATTLLTTAIAARLLHSYWALWVGPFVAAGVNVVLLWLSDRWRPRWGGDFAGVRAMLRFGVDVTGYNLKDFFGRNLDNVLIARVWGPRQVGLYDRGYKLMMFPLSNISDPLGRVMIPVLSRVLDRPVEYRNRAL